MIRITISAIAAAAAIALPRTKRRRLVVDLGIDLGHGGARLRRRQARRSGVVRAAECRPHRRRYRQRHRPCTRSFSLSGTLAKACAHASCDPAPSSGARAVRFGFALATMRPRSDRCVVTPLELGKRLARADQDVLERDDWFAARSGDGVVVLASFSMA